jgi:hypothetical protein
MVDERANDDETPAQGSDAASEATPDRPAAAKPRRSRVSARVTRTPAADVAATTGNGQVALVGEVTEQVNAESLSISQGGVNIAQAGRIDLRQGGITRAQAEDITVTQGAIGMARGDRVSVEMGAIGLAVGGQVHLSQGVAGSILAREVRIEQGGARTVIASHATFQQTSGTIMLIAGKVDGNVRTILDWRGAAIFGVVFGLVAGLVRRRR